METKKRADLPRRYAVFILGLFIASMGVALSTKADLGTSPVVSLPYAVSLVWPALTLGGWLNVLSVIQIAAQIVVQKGKCDYLEISIQTVLAFAYGYLTDFSRWLIRDMAVTGYPAQFLVMLLGCAVVAAGLWVQFKGGVALLPGEALNRAIGRATGRRYEDIKIFFDAFYVISAAVISLVFTGRLRGVREGSIIAAILIGVLIKALNRGWDRIVKGRQAKA